MALTINTERSAKRALDGANIEIEAPAKAPVHKAIVYDLFPWRSQTTKRQYADRTFH